MNSLVFYNHGSIVPSRFTLIKLEKVTQLKISQFGQDPVTEPYQYITILLDSITAITLTRCIRQLSHDYTQEAPAFSL